jgi:hypothetical protein
MQRVMENPYARLGYNIGKTHGREIPPGEDRSTGLNLQDAWTDMILNDFEYILKGTRQEKLDFMFVTLQEFGITPDNFLFTKIPERFV